MKICFWTSYSDNNLNVFNLSLHNHDMYCKQHNYSLINYKEPYNKYINVNRILNLFNDYDIVISIGTDIIFKRIDDEIDRYIDQHGITMCREIHHLHVLNGDFIIYTNCEETKHILKLINDNQRKYEHGQAYINYLTDNNLININNSQYLQIAAPVRNSNYDYSKYDLNKYLTFHYHTLGWAPNPNRKYHYMYNDLNIDK